MSSPEHRVSERTLVASASQGDDLALQTLFERHLPGLRTFLRLRMGPRLRARESVSDLVQSVCREVLEHVDRFQYGGEAEFKNWLYREGLRKVLNRVAFHDAQKRDIGREVQLARRERDEDAATLSQLYHTLHTPSQDIAAQEEAERIQRAFDLLPEDHRQVVLLAKVVGLPHKRIAEEMGRSEGATRVLLHRALVTLAAQLEEG